MALTRALFQLRTRFLENRIESDHVYAMASGLLIGHEVAAASVGQQETIHLAASAMSLTVMKRPWRSLG